MENIPIEAINTKDRRFCISYPLHDNHLLASIEKIGIIEPIILLKVTPYIVISGFKRLEAAITFNHSHTPSLIQNIPEQQAFLYAIHNNITRGFNLVEKAIAFERMFHFNLTTPEVTEIITMLEIKSSEKIFKNLMAIANGEKALKDFIVVHNISMKNVEALLRFEPEERRSLISILSSLHFTDSSLREILELLSLMKVKKDAIDFNIIDHAKTMDEIRNILKRKIYPKLTSLEKRLQNIHKECGLPPNMDIKVDPFFEKEYIDIWIRARKEKEVHDAISKLMNLLKQGYIRSILELSKH
jgi:ParB-like chromosome segregation protein Spo0J